MASLYPMSAPSGASRARSTYQLHDRPDGPLNVDPVVANNRDYAGRAANRGELNERRVVVHQSFQILGTLCHHPVHLARKDGAIPRDELLSLQVTRQARQPEVIRLYRPC